MACAIQILSDRVPGRVRGGFKVLTAVAAFVSAAVRGRRAGVSSCVLGIVLGVVGFATAAPAQPAGPLVSDRLLIQGTRLSIAPGDEAQVLNVAESASVRTCFAGVCGGMAAGDSRVAGLLAQGELSGPELPEPLTYSAVPGGAFLVPGFQAEGTYVLSNIRLVRAGTGEVLGSATPSAVVLEVRQILLSSATIRQLSLEELKARGIEITQQNFQAFSNVTSWKTSHGTGATAGYDAWDRPVEVTTGLSTGISKPVPATVKRSYYLNGLLEREERSQKQQDGTSRLVTTSYFYNDRQQVRFIERDGLAAETAGGPAVAKGRTEFRYNPGTGLLKDVISPAGIVTHYEYDTAGRLKSEKTGDSLARTRGYDELWRPSYEHDGDEAEWTGSYDKLGRLTAESYPTGASASRTFDKAGRLSTQTISGQGDPSGVLSSIVAHVTSFGAVGLVKEMQSEGAILEVVRSFDTNGRLARQTSSGRLDAELEYETGTGRLLSLTDSTSQTVLRYGDDSSPWPDQVDFYETPSGASCGAPESTTTSYLERDALGAVTLETSNDGTQTTVDYDEEGRPLSVASSAGPTSTFAWDSRGALISATRPEGRGTTRYGYDLDGRIRAKSAIASTGQTFDVSYGYDASGRLWHVQRAGQPIETFEYYPDGVVSKYTRRDGAVVSYEYDAANRMISATPSAAPGGIGSLVVDGGQSYVWDALSRLLSTQRLTGSGIDPRTSVAYGAFDQAGRPRDEIVGTRNALTRTYDVFGRTVNLGLPLGVGAHQALDYLRQYEGCSKRLLTLTSPNGPAALGATWAWAGDGRLLGITTNGPLKTAHRFGYIGGPGAQPGDSGDGSSGKWRLGTLTVGGAGTTDAAMAPPLGDGDSTVWGQFQFGYRHRDNAKLGRLVTSPGTSSILSSQGWAWGIDAASRLTSATAGKGTLTGITAGATANAVERFQYDYGMADQVVRLAREVSTEDVEQVAGTDGRPLSRTVDGEPPGSEFAYDGAGRRVEDDRFTYRWHWFGKLAEVLVKESWPPRTPGGVPVVSPHAGHLIKWEYDALGRTFGRTHLGRLPEGSTDDCTRPFIERREFLWEGGNLLGEAGYAAGPDGACSETIGAIRWRKSYVPGAAGLDDQVQVRVESYGAGSEVASDKLYSYLRDDMNSILSLVEERVGGDAAKPQVPLRFLYTPYGEAHAETGPEVRKTRFDPSLSSLGVQNQVVGDTNHVPGGMTIDFSVPIDLGTLPGGAIVERRITDGTWGALTAEELALGRGTEPERLVLLPLAGWQLGTTYRVRLTPQLKDDAGRSVTAPPTLEFPLPEPVAEGQIGSYSVSYERVFAVEYESAFAAAETAGGAFPGGQNLGWQGHWVDPVTGLDMVRARVYDPRTASWLSEDPLEDVDSPNLYGYVAGRPHEATDPWGLQASNYDEIMGPILARMGASGELTDSLSSQQGWDEVIDASEALGNARVRSHFGTTGNLLPRKNPNVKGLDGVHIAGSGGERHLVIVDSKHAFFEARRISKVDAFARTSPEAAIQRLQQLGAVDRDTAGVLLRNVKKTKYVVVGTGQVTGLTPALEKNGVTFLRLEGEAADLLRRIQAARTGPVRTLLEHRAARRAATRAAKIAGHGAVFAAMALLAGAAEAEDPRQALAEAAIHLAPPVAAVDSMDIVLQGGQWLGARAAEETESQFDAIRRRRDRANRVLADTPLPSDLTK